MPTPILCALLTLCALPLLRAQDLHYSQFYHAPLAVNPAQTGHFEGDYRMGANARRQWQSVPVGYHTLSGWYDQRLAGGRWAVGVIFNHDQTGDAKLRWSQLGGSAAWHQPVAEAHTLSAGVQALAGQRAFDPALLSFGDQFNGDIFDPSQASLDAFGRQARTFLDLTAGATWHYRATDTRSQVVGGLAWAHLNRPLVGFFEDDPARLPMRGVAHLHASVEASSRADLLLHGLWQFQGPYREMLLGLGGRLYLDSQPGGEVALVANLAYRLWDAPVVQLGLLYQQWEVGLSYDINTSPFAVATRGRGGPELALRYIVAKVKAPDEFKICPVF